MKVFLSHSSRNRKRVRALAYDLTSIGLDVWLDEWEIKIGDSITQKIQRGLERSDFVGIWITEHAVRSGWVEREWMAKFSQEIGNKRAAVIPMLAQKCEIPYLLRDYKYANFMSNYQAGLRSLIDMLDPNHRSYIAALKNIRTETTFLWNDIKWLPLNQQSSVSTEIRESTYQDIRENLRYLSDVGGLFKFSVEKAGYTSKDGKEVLLLSLSHIDPKFTKLIQTDWNDGIPGKDREHTS